MPEGLSYTPEIEKKPEAPELMGASKYALLQSEMYKRWSDEREKRYPLEHQGDSLREQSELYKLASNVLKALNESHKPKNIDESFNAINNLLISSKQQHEHITNYLAEHGTVTKKDIRDLELLTNKISELNFAEHIFLDYISKSDQEKEYFENKNI